MAKVRVYELARELGLESKDVLERAQELGLDVKTASSGLDEEGVGLVKLSYEGTATDSGAAESEDSSPTVEAAPESPGVEEPTEALEVQNTGSVH